MESVIKLEELSFSYENGHGVSELNLECKKGTITGFLGPNGAGKTTTIKLMLGLLYPSSGKVLLNGQLSTDANSRLAIGYLPETAYYYKFMKLGELVKFYGKLCGMSKALIKSRAEYLVKLVKLEDDLEKKLGSYSKGMLQRAGLMCALLHDPEILILDEPMTGLDPLGRRLMKDILRQLRTEGKSIFFSSHELSEAETICDNLAVMRGGKCIWQGEAKDLPDYGKKSLEEIFLAMVGDN